MTVVNIGGGEIRREEERVCWPAVLDRMAGNTHPEEDRLIDQ